MQGFFFAGNLQKMGKFHHFMSKTPFFKRAFDVRLPVDVKQESARKHKILCLRAPIGILRSICGFFEIVPQIFPSKLTKFSRSGRGGTVELWSTPAQSPGFSGSVLPASLSRCSCMAAAEALRNRTRDCFTSSRAAWTASSVRARASSAYSLATW